MPLRPESSVSVGFNEYGELQFACDQPGPVRHYTPEQLGLARVVSGAASPLAGMARGPAMAGIVYRAWPVNEDPSRRRRRSRSASGKLGVRDHIDRMMEMRRAGLTMQAIANAFGVSRQYVQLLFKGRGHGASESASQQVGSVPPVTQAGWNLADKMLEERRQRSAERVDSLGRIALPRRADIDKMVEMHRKGMSYRAIAGAVGISFQRVCQLLKREAREAAR